MSTVDTVRSTCGVIGAARLRKESRMKEVYKKHISSMTIEERKENSSFLGRCTDDEFIEWMKYHPELWGKFKRILREYRAVPGGLENERQD